MKGKASVIDQPSFELGRGTSRRMRHASGLVRPQTKKKRKEEWRKEIITWPPDLAKKLGNTVKIGKTFKVERWTSNFVCCAESWQDNIKNKDLKTSKRKQVITIQILASVPHNGADSLTVLLNVLMTASGSSAANSAVPATITFEPARAQQPIVPGPTPPST